MPPAWEEIIVTIADLPKLPTKDFAVADNAKESQNQVYYRMAGKKRRADATWYRGENTNFHPMRASLDEFDAVDRYVGLGWLPPAPFIDREQYITAFGSCFAAEVSRFLIGRGYRVFGGDLGLNAHIVRSGEGIVNTAAVRQQFEWAWEGRGPESAVWHDKTGATQSSAGDVMTETRSIFDRTDIFIITLGLSEVWYDRATGDVFWRAVPKQAFDPERHGFRVMGAVENLTNLRKITELIRENRPEAEIVLTLSPVPLAATFRPVSCITANSVSKASLRVAIDELMREHESDPRLHYFPSYEIVTTFIDDAFGDDLRHPRPEAISFVMDTFARHYLLG